jgi:hypothetical protein
MNFKKMSALVVLAGALAAPAVLADAATDAKKAAELQAQAKQAREDANKNREAAYKNLEAAGAEEAKADDECVKANKLDAEARSLLKMSAEEAEAQFLWHRAGERYNLANLRSLQAQNAYSRGKRFEKTGADLASAAKSTAQAASAAPDAKEKARLQGEAKDLDEQAKFNEKEAQTAKSNGDALAAEAKNDRDLAAQDANRAKALDPKIATTQAASHPTSTHSAK